MAWTLADLKAADAALGSPQPAPTDAAATLNTQTVTLPAQDFRWSEIRDILMNNFDWGALVQATEMAVGGTLPGGGSQTTAIQAAAIAIHECCIYGGTLNASNATVWGKLTTVGSLLDSASAGIVSSASVTAIVALRTPTVPKWQPAVTGDDVIAARAS